MMNVGVWLKPKKIEICFPPHKSGGKLKPVGNSKSGDNSKHN